MITTATPKLNESRLSVPNDANASGRSFGNEELRLLKDALERGGLVSQYGKIVPELEKTFAEWVGADHCVAVSSGTAAIHAAVAAIDPAPGDEIVTSPITDMGGVMPILYQSAVPVFADVDPRTCNVTAETIAERITDRTRAIIVTHLFGLPVEMDPVLDLARSKGIPVIEDAAQAFGARYKGRAIGTIGDIGCFSLQQGKHITCGEGGCVVTSDERLARTIRRFHDKAWDFGEPGSDHYFLALNYRMTELQGAVALAQMGRLDEFVEHRRRMADRLTDAIADVHGLICPGDTEHATHVYWRYPLRVEPPLDGPGLDRLSQALREIGARTAPRYTQKLAFEYAFLRDRRMFGGSGFPFVGPQREGTRPLLYDRQYFPGAAAGLANLLCIAWNERIDEPVVDWIAETIRQAAREIA